MEVLAGSRSGLPGFRGLPRGFPKIEGRFRGMEAPGGRFRGRAEDFPEGECARGMAGDVLRGVGTFPGGGCREVGAS